MMKETGKKTAYYLMFTGTLLLLLLSCSQEDIVTGVRTTHQIGFSALTQGTTRNYGAITNENVNTVGNSMAVWGYKETSPSAAIFSNTPVTYDAANGWSYTPIRFWDAQSDYKFYAVMPSTVSVTAAPDAYAPTQGFTIENIPTVQQIGSGTDIDYLVSDCKTIDKPATGKTVEFTLHHLLSRLNVLAKAKVINGNYTVTLNYLGLYLPDGTVTYTQKSAALVQSYGDGSHGTAADAWSTTPAIGATAYDVYPAGILELDDNAGTDNYKKLTHSYFVAPTEVKTDGSRTAISPKMKISFNVAFDDGVTTNSEDYVYDNLSVQDLHNFTQGYITNLYVLLDMSSGSNVIKFAVDEVPDWTDSDDNYIDGEGHSFNLTSANSATHLAPATPAASDRVRVVIDNLDEQGRQNEHVGTQSSLALTYIPSCSESAVKFYRGATGDTELTSLSIATATTDTVHFYASLPANATDAVKEYTVTVTTNQNDARSITLYQAAPSLEATFSYNGTAITLDAANHGTFSYAAGVPLSMALTAGSGVTVTVNANDNEELDITKGSDTQSHIYSLLNAGDAVTIETAKKITTYTVILTSGSRTTTYVLTRGAPAGALPGLFSVSASQKVYFSTGNLQYQANTTTWRFAQHQYDYIGDAAGNNTSSANRATQSDWIDYFGWGTSGYDNKWPYQIWAGVSYYAYPNVTTNISGTNYDWGVYNAISNGGNESGLWRTFTKDEWQYLLEDRTNASAKRSLATITGITVAGNTDVEGLIILPDNWTLPAGLTFWGNYDNFTNVSYTLEQWTLMEANGAVFLPVAGYRDGQDCYSDWGGCYWSSTSAGGNEAYGLNFYATGIHPFMNDLKRHGYSVRLVQNE